MSDNITRLINLKVLYHLYLIKSFEKIKIEINIIEKISNQSLGSLLVKANC